MLNVLIVDYKGDAGVDKEFRLRRDPDFMVRLNQHWPEGIRDSLLYEKVGGYYGASVAGITQPDFYHNANLFVQGARRRIDVVRDPQNVHDRNAIKVVGHWQDSTGRVCSGQLGWVPKEEAALIAKNWPDGPIGARLEVIFLPQPGKSLGLRIDIGRPRPPTVRKAKGPKKKPPL